MQGICRLCEKTAELQVSHVIPAFVFRWRKHTSLTPYMRSSMDPERRVQDGPKQHWLCRDCEQLISQWEREFATTIFHPITQNGSHRISYSDWLLKFCVSISWRALLGAKEQTSLAQFSERQRTAADGALHAWREFLWQRAPHPGPYEQHLLIFEDAQSFGPGFPANMHRYAMRTIDLDIPHTEKFGFTFVKMGPFAVLGFFLLDRPREWSGGKVHVKKGFVGPNRYELPVQFRDYLISRAHKTAAIMEGLSDEQRAVANRTSEVALERRAQEIGDSHWARAMQRDFGEFGEDAFKVGWPGKGEKPR